MMPVDDEIKNLNLIEEKLKNILDEHNQSIPYGTVLFKFGLNSIKTVMLIAALEETFDILFEEHELIFENFSTIYVIADLVKEKLVNKR